MIEHIRGDTLKIIVTVRDSDGNLVDLTNYEIRAEIKGEDISIKKASANVTGGSSDEVDVTSTGTIEINFSSSETSQLQVGFTYKLEVEITSPEGVKTTIVQDLINVKEDIITWESK